MNIDFRPYLISWAVLALAVIVLFLWRRHVALKEDDTLRVLEAPSVAAQQLDVANKLAVLDRWGKIVTAVTVLYGIIIAGAWAYQYFLQSTHTGFER